MPGLGPARGESEPNACRADTASRPPAGGSADKAGAANAQPPGRGHNAVYSRERPDLGFVSRPCNYDAVNSMVQPDLGLLPRPPLSEGPDTSSSFRVSTRCLLFDPPDVLLRSPIGPTEGMQVPSEPNVSYDYTQPPGRGHDAVKKSELTARPGAVTSTASIGGCRYVNPSARLDARAT